MPETWDKSLKAKIEELAAEVAGFVAQDGWSVVGREEMDHGLTVKLLIEKDGKKRVVPIFECYYDTNEKGERTEFHGAISIKQSPWYRRKKEEAEKASRSEVTP